MSLALAAASFLPSAMPESHDQHSTALCSEPWCWCPYPVTAVASLPSPVPATLPPFWHAGPIGWQHDAWCTLWHPTRPGPCGYCHLPTPTHTSSPTQTVFLICITHFQLFADPNPVFCQPFTSWHSSAPFLIVFPALVGDVLDSHCWGQAVWVQDGTPVP